MGAFYKPENKSFAEKEKNKCIRNPKGQWSSKSWTGRQLSQRGSRKGPAPACALPVVLGTQLRPGWGQEPHARPLLLILGWSPLSPTAGAGL